MSHETETTTNPPTAAPRSAAERMRLYRKLLEDVARSPRAVRDVLYAHLDRTLEAGAVTPNSWRVKQEGINTLGGKTKCERQAIWVPALRTVTGQSEGG